MTVTPALRVRVSVTAVWDTVELNLTPESTIAQLKAEALAREATAQPAKQQARQQRENATQRREFDAVLSNAVLHWVKDADAAIANVHCALVGGGRFVAELGGARCIEKIRGALHEALLARAVNPDALDPWYFPSDVEYRTRLEKADFQVCSIVLFDRPTALPGDISASSRYFARDVIVPPVTVNADGTVDVPQRSGLGFEVDVDYLSSNTENVERIKVKKLTA